MIATERYLYERDLDDLAKSKLSFSENRRSKLLSHNVTLKRNHLNWKSYRNYLIVYQTLRDSGTRLASAEAGLASLKLAAKNQEDSAILTTSEVADVSRKVERMRRDHDELSRQTSLTRLKHAGLDGPHHGARLFLSQYVQALEEESQILETARESQKGTAYRLLASDAKEQWAQWRFAIGTILEGFKELDQDINGSLSESAQKLDELSARQRALTSRMYTIVGSLEASLGSQLHSILNDYSAALSQKSSRTKKWRADIDWLEFQQKQKEESSLTQKFELEKQILDENLRDIRQGLIW